MDLFAIVILALLNLPKKQLRGIYLKKQFFRTKHFKPILQ